MGILASDILLKTMFEAALADLRKNTWILSEIFEGLTNDPLSTMDYGWKEVDKAKEWFMGNDIPVYLTNRVDTPRFPCITIVRTSSREMTERTAMADDHEPSEIDPYLITKNPQRMYNFFTPAGYNSTTGVVTLPENLQTNRMFVGQFIVSKRSGKAYIITQVLAPNQFMILPGTNDDFTSAYIAPPTSLWNLEKELTFVEEAFAIGMHAESDINQAIFLRQLVQYIVLRYKEAFMERRGYELSTFNVGSIDVNPHFNGTEMVYSCMMTLSGQVEANFIKYAAPKIQGIKAGLFILDGPKTPEEYLIYAERQGWEMEGDEGKRKRRKPKGDLE
jgi:hypothetical protein